MTSPSAAPLTVILKVFLSVEAEAVGVMVVLYSAHSPVRPVISCEARISSVSDRRQAETVTPPVGALSLAQKLTLYSQVESTLRPLYP